jgi:hypothetical protein
MTLSRREFGIGAVALAALGGVTLGYRHIFGRGYAPTPYDDLLHQIVDREPATVLGKALPKPDVAALAARLRQPGFALERRARADAAAGRVVEAHGWIVPESVAAYAQLAAQF